MRIVAFETTLFDNVLFTIFEIRAARESESYFRLDVSRPKIHEGKSFNFRRLTRLPTRNFQLGNLNN